MTVQRVYSHRAHAACATGAACVRAILALAATLPLLALACGGPRAPLVAPPPADRSGPLVGDATRTHAPVPTVPSDPLAAVLAAMRAQQDAPFVRNEVTTTIDESTTTRTIERVVPDRYRLTASDGSPALVLIGDRGWMQAGDRWIESAVARQMAGTLHSAFFDGASIAAIEAEATDVARVGIEDVAGQEAQRYRFEQSVDSEGVEMSIRTDFWVRARDGLPTQIIVATEAKGATSVTAQRLGYDAIVIAPPGP